MPLSVGDKLGPYEILTPIGKGVGGATPSVHAYFSRVNR